MESTITSSQALTQGVAMSPAELLSETQGTVSIRDQLAAHLDTLPANERLERLTHLLTTAPSYTERLDELTAEAWAYLVEKQLWLDSYPSLERLQDSLNFNQSLKATIKRHYQTSSRKQQSIAGIKKQWGSSPDQLIPHDMVPPFFSTDFLRALLQLSKACSLDAAIPLLSKAIQTRIQRPRTSKESHLLPGDLKAVCADLKLLKRKTPLSSTYVEELDDEDAEVVEEEGAGGPAVPAVPVADALDQPATAPADQRPRLEVADSDAEVEAEANQMDEQETVQTNAIQAKIAAVLALAQLEADCQNVQPEEENGQQQQQQQPEQQQEELDERASQQQLHQEDAGQQQLQQCQQDESRVVVAEDEEKEEEEVENKEGEEVEDEEEEGGEAENEEGEEAEDEEGEEAEDEEEEGEKEEDEAIYSKGTDKGKGRQMPTPTRCQTLRSAGRVEEDEEEDADTPTKPCQTGRYTLRSARIVEDDEDNGDDEGAQPGASSNAQPSNSSGNTNSPKAVTNTQPNIFIPLAFTPSFTSINMPGHPIINPVSTRPSTPSVLLSAFATDCSCTSAIKQELDAIHGILEDKLGLLLIFKVANARLENLCHLHLRKLAKSSVGLKNNLSGPKLLQRLGIIRRHGQQLAQLRVGHPDWFVRSRRPSNRSRLAGPPSSQLVLYQHQPSPPSLFILDRQLVLERFAGQGAWAKWKSEGTLIIPNIFDYLNEPDIINMIDQEFAMYQHHAIPNPDQPRQGWCRNMYYSLIQQLVRQDPVWYALCAALQGSERLVAYPYIAKDATPGEKTGFLHLDINVSTYLQSLPRGYNSMPMSMTLPILTSSLSLDDEEPTGCTLLVPGFHHVIKSWYTRVMARGENSTGFTTNCSSTYRKEDQDMWGKPVPVPCRAFGLRITRPEIIHGSTNQASTRRRTLFAWYKVLEDDHQTFKGAGSLTWSDVAACHRDLMIPSEEPSGQSLKHQVPTTPFPGSIPLPSISPLLDALIGKKRWTDPLVIHERNCLFGTDTELAWAFVQQIRAGMLEAYKKSWLVMQQTEQDRFGQDSFFGSSTTDSEDEEMAEIDDSDAEKDGRDDIEGDTVMLEV